MDSMGCCKWLCSYQIILHFEAYPRYDCILHIAWTQQSDKRSTSNADWKIKDDTGSLDHKLINKLCSYNKFMQV